MDPRFYKYFKSMKATALVDVHSCATCGQGEKFYSKQNDLSNHFQNQHDFCHTMCSTLLHELYDGTNKKKPKNKNKNKKKNKKVNKARWVNFSVRR